MSFVSCVSLTVILLFFSTQLEAVDGHGSWVCYLRNGTAGGINYTRCDSTDSCSNSNKLEPLGFLGAFIAIIGFGSNFLPVKKLDTGNGIFFQWILCIGIWLVGLVVGMIYQPRLYLPALLGGLLWTAGNALVVPIIKAVGLTMGLTVWGVTNMLSGWASGRFILKQGVQCNPLNYSGVVTVVISVVMLAFVKSEGKAVGKKLNAISKEESESGERAALLNGDRSSLEGSLQDRVLRQGHKKASSIQSSSDEHLSFGRSSDVPAEETTSDEDDSWIDHFGVWPRRILGFAMALLAGVLFGFQFLPVEFMKLCTDQYHSCEDLEYVFSHFTGILVVSTAIFIVYSIYTCNKPKPVYPKSILPGLCSGIIWGIAMVGWFVANKYLSLGVSFPIVTAGPGFISSAYGIFIFKEIKGWPNRLLYFIAFIVSMGGLVMVGVSHCTHCGGHKNATDTELLWT